MYSRSAARPGSTVRSPVNAGAGRSSARHSTGVRRARASASGRSGRRVCSAWSVAQPLLVGARLGVEAPRAARGRAGPRRRGRRATRRARAASASSTRARSARPCAGSTSSRRRSGAAASSPRRSISSATWTISSSDGVISPESPTRSQFSSTAVSRIRSLGTMTPRSIDLVVVAAEDDPDDVLADVVDVALDRREHELPLRARLALHALGLHVRLEVGDGALHRPRALHDLREEHLPRAEEVAHDLHPVHERALDHVERARRRPGAPPRCPPR